MTSRIAKFLRPIICLMVFSISFSSFGQLCGRYLYSGPEITTEEIIAFNVRKIFKDDPQNFDSVDAYLAKFLAQKVQKLSPRLRDEFLTKMEWVYWVDHIRTPKIDKSLVGLHDPKTNETYLVHDLKGTIQARLTLVHELTHLEQYLTRTRTFLRAVTYDSVLKEESEAQIAEHDFLTGLFLENPNLKEKFLEDESLWSYWNCSKKSYVCDGIKTYKRTNAIHNRSLIFKLGVGYTAVGACTWVTLWSLFH